MQTSGLPGKIVLLVVVTTGCALLFEVGVRIFHPQNLINNEPIYRYDPAFEKRLIPNTQFQFATPEYEYTVTTNSLGFRDSEHLQTKPPGVQRILILGDSFTFGPGVAQNKIFPQLLESYLNQNAEHPYEVITMACGGFGPEHYRAMLEHEGLKFEPDAVVLAIYVDNDVTDRLDLSQTPAPLKPSLLIRLLYPINNWLEERSHAFVFVRKRLEYPLWKLGLRPYYFPPVFWRNISPELESEWQRTFQVLTEIHTRCEENDIELLSVLIPARYQVHRQIWEKFVSVYNINPDSVDLELPQKRLSDFFTTNKIDYIDLLPQFREVGKQRLLYFPIDGHWNAQGHELCARALYKYFDSDT